MSTLLSRPRSLLFGLGEVSIIMRHFPVVGAGMTSPPRGQLGAVAELGPGGLAFCLGS